MINKLERQGIVVVGGQWGDEGKGRIVDSLATDCDVIVRFHGGNNAGHSLHIGDISLVLHLIPCGIMRPGKISIIGNGVVIDPEALFDEIKLLAKHDVHCSPKNLRIAKNAHIIFPFHKIVDIKRESNELSHIGTTKRGIGPCYEDKVARFGIVANDLLSKDVLAHKLERIFKTRDCPEFKDERLSLDHMIAWAYDYKERLAPFLCDTGEIIEEAFLKNQRVLFEGAQGTLLDVDHGTYPYVTSSNCVAAAAAIGSGIGMHWLREVIMVSKAYCTRVGEGPFFSEGDIHEQEKFRRLGNEFGATTGRPRRCGWLDLPALKYAARLNGATSLVLTKVDILAAMGPIKIATSYSHSSKNDLNFLEACDLFSRGEKIDVDYVVLPEAGAMPDNARDINDLPKSIQELCTLIEKTLAIPICMISFGPKRGQELSRKSLAHS